MKRVWQDWLLVAAWMAVMFTMSGSPGSGEHTIRVIEPVVRWLNPDITPEAVSVTHHWTRKAGHVLEYLVLALLTLRAMRTSLRVPTRVWNRRAAGWALLITVAFAASDEYHQTFVATRGPSAYDVLLDTCGTACGLLVARLWMIQRRVPRTGPLIRPAPNL